MSIYTFHEHYLPRIWGGDSLAKVFGKSIPNEPIGEAWLISDHIQHSSVVNRGPDSGATLRDLLERNTNSIIGERVKLTVHGRFPLLLKLLDAQDRLSIQVHPDDLIAAELHENDVGKTEMWHVLRAEPGAQLYCGMPEEVTPEEVESYFASGGISERLTTLIAKPGMSILVPAGIIHAIGEGCLLAEIQQNSDLTYRIDDWGRQSKDGSFRKLHLEKGKLAIRYPNIHSGPSSALEYEVDGGVIRVLGACDFFAAEELILSGECASVGRDGTFQIVLAKSGSVSLDSSDSNVKLEKDEAALITGDDCDWTLNGKGSVLMYYVPEFEKHIRDPLLEAGHKEDNVAVLKS